MIPSLLILAARLLGQIKREHVLMIFAWIDQQARIPGKEGWRKMDAVIDRFRARIGDRERYIIQTVIQMLFTVVRMKGGGV